MYAIHIAAFFFISGYIFNPQKDLTVLIVDRAKRLLVPCFSYNLLFFSLFIILKIFSVDTFFYGSQQLKTFASPAFEIILEWSLMIVTLTGEMAGKLTFCKSSVFTVKNQIKGLH